MWLEEVEQKKSSSIWDQTCTDHELDNCLKDDEIDIVSLKNCNIFLLLFPEIYGGSALVNVKIKKFYGRAILEFFLPFWFLFYGFCFKFCLSAFVVRDCIE